MGRSCRTPAAGMTLLECTACQRRDQRPMSCGHRSCNHKSLDGQLGMTGVLHTHSRRLDYHPHVHFVVPGGGINTRRREWRKLKGKYLFNSNNLARIFRGRLLKALKAGNHRLLPCFDSSLQRLSDRLTAWAKQPMLEQWH